MCAWCRRHIGSGTCVGDCDIDGVRFARVPFGGESVFLEDCRVPDWSCHDCAAKAGEFHHRCCCVEECPRCGDQFLSCGCLIDPDEEEFDDVS